MQQRIYSSDKIRLFVLTFYPCHAIFMPKTDSCLFTTQQQDLCSDRTQMLPIFHLRSTGEETC